MSTTISHTFTATGVLEWDGAVRPPIGNHREGASVATLERLRPLLEAARDLDLEDHPEWERLRDVARSTMSSLIAGGALPRHLDVAEDAPPVLVARTLAAAWRRATAHAT